MSLKPYREIALKDWLCGESTEHITLACLRQLIDEVRDLRTVLVSRLDSLGGDGLHAILRDEAKRRAARRAREQKHRAQVLRDKAARRKR
jgi:hypothetical protein